MCGGAVGLAKTLSRTMPRRKPSFYKRHPECRHKSSSPRKQTKVKYHPRRSKKLIYYSEKQRLPLDLHHKIVYTILLVLGTPVLIALLINFMDYVFGFMFLAFLFLTWLTALCYMAYQLWHTEPQPYREPKEHDDIQTW